MPRKIKTLFFLIVVTASLQSFGADISGAGSSAAKPIYNQWADAYQRRSGVRVNYDPVGSSSGIKKIKTGTIDFGASDVTLTMEDAEKSQLFCFPSAISGVVPVVNLPGLKAGELKLTGELLAAIFGGKISAWNDPAIVAVNPGAKLPSLPIIRIVREDGSGTTYNFSDYLSKLSPEWKSAFGSGFLISWPNGVVKAKGSSAVSEAVRSRIGGIGYIDYNYVVQDRLDYARLKNRSGTFVSPDSPAFSAALENSDWKTSTNFQQMLTDLPGSRTWPITMGTFVIVPKVTADPQRTIQTLKFFTWALMSGDKLVAEMDFVKLPDMLQARIYRELTTIRDKQGKVLEWSPVF